MLAGTLAVGPDRRHVRILRAREEGGERVELSFGGTAASLTWSAGAGAASSTGAATDAERAVIERIALDSPDHFVLAQLTGAGYHTLARNARPRDDDGSDSYAGPLYDLVRVSEPGAASGPGGARLYYLNSRTGLIDRVDSVEQGETVVAELSGWANHQGELLPTRIVWKRQGQVIMELSVAGSSHGPRR